MPETTPEQQLIAELRARISELEREARESTDETVRLLEASEKRLSALMVHAHDMFIIHDATGQLVFESPATQRILGYMDVDGNVPHGFDHLLPDDREQARAVFQRALAAPGEPVRHRWRMVCQDGSVIDTFGHTTDLRHVPEVAGVVTNLRNITDLVEAHERIHSNEAVMSEAQRVGQVGWWEHTLQQDDEPVTEVAQWSPQMYRILGHGPGTIISSFTNFLNAVHPDDRAYVEDQLRNAVRNDLPCSIDHRIIRPDGTVRWLHQESIVMQDQRPPHPRRVVGTMQDITERKLAEEQGRASEERFRAVIEGSNDGISITAADTSVVYISPSVERILGYTAEEMAGASSLNVVWEEHRHAFQEIYNKVLSQPGTIARLQVKVRRKDGSLGWVDSLITNMFHVPAVHGIVTNYRDITDLMTLHEERDFDRANLNALINSTQDLVWSVDRDYRVIAMNKAAMNTFEPVLGHRIRPGDSLYVPDVKGVSPTRNWYAYFERALKGETFKVEEYTAPPYDAHIEVSYTPIRDMGEVVGVAVFVRNITAKRKAQEALQRLNTHLEDRVVDRTKELILVNEELEERTEQNKRLAREVAARNKELMDSINYASNIQRALMPERERFALFRDMGLLYRPRDVVSGDFMWCYETPDQLMVVVADCTGHGVPGAMMSMMGHDLLNHSVQDNAPNAPHHILQQLDASLYRLFHRTQGAQLTDGMDAAVLVVDKTSMQISFSGAMLPLLVIRAGEPILLPGSKATLGGHLSLHRKEFTVHERALLPGDRLCLFTDGYGDQFGGVNNKKYYRRHFLDLLVKLHTNGMDAREAATELDREFTTWMEGHEQVDDVLVLLLDV